MTVQTHSAIALGLIKNLGCQVRIADGCRYTAGTLHESIRGGFFVTCPSGEEVYFTEPEVIDIFDGGYPLPIIRLK